jgi:hypothetical protein
LRVILESPSGGEKWTGGKEQIIDWAIIGGEAPYKIKLTYSLDGGESYPYDIVSLEGVERDKYTWLTPRYISQDKPLYTDKARVKIEVEDRAGEKVSAISRENFIIDAVPPRIVYKYPDKETKDKLPEVSIFTQIELGFSEGMNKESVEESLEIEGVNLGKASWEALHIKFYPQGFIPGKVYKVFLEKEVRDISSPGNVLLGEYPLKVLEFKTWGGAVEVEVVSAGDAEPIEGAKVNLEINWEEMESRLKGIYQGWWEGMKKEYVTDKEGRCEIKDLVFGVYTFKVSARGFEPEVKEKVEVLTREEELKIELERKFKDNFLAQNRPNPFNPLKERTRIKYGLAERVSFVKLNIYTLDGELVKRLVFERMPKVGKVRAVDWDGRNERNELVASGTYVLYLKAGSWYARKLIVVLKRR